MSFLGTGMLATVGFWILALAVGDVQYTKKATLGINKQRHNTRRLLFVIVGIIIVRIFVIICSCHDKTQPVTQSVRTRPT
jgi:uncharacterized membrane protein